MMKTGRHLLLVTSAFLFIDSVCFAPIAAAKTPNTVHKVFVLGPSGTMPATPCVGPASAKKLKFVVKDNILKIFNDKNYEGREVYLDNVLAPPPVLDPNGNLIKTNYDMAIPSPTPGTAWTQVKIVVKKATSDGVNLLVPRADIGNPAATDSSVAILIPSGKEASFCGRSKIDTSTGDQVVTFGVMLAPYEETSINIGLLVADKKHPGNYIPIYLDPNMKNPG